MFSSRLPEHLTPTPFFNALESERTRAPYTDLTASSPAETGILRSFSFTWNSEEAKVKSSETAAAVAAYYAARGIPAEPAQIRFTSGTSEAYSVLFKTLCNPGDVILTPVPGYPLLETLSELEFLNTYPYFLKQSGGAWKIDLKSLESAPPEAKILLLVSPHNPTGHCVSAAEWGAILSFCEERKMVLVVDEVFGDYTEAGVPRSLLYPRSNVPVFWLNGLSKTAGLPTVKLSWLYFHVPEPEKEALQNALDYVLDAYLSVSSMAQKMARPLLADSFEFQTKVKERLSQNRDILRRYFPPEKLSLGDGGWYASLYFENQDDEVLAFQLLQKHRILVHPGFFFDFQEDGWIVVSLLTEPDLFEKSIQVICS
ncbi:MAG: pyridoxal phosphate-dependent aminotransferase [Fibrobacter sp.]|jgi:aspartate/methionine/tyrosine aminotransferase|nr:pyridoxal phosphate-dependent aminotransferase [Fibrobacter sp.]